MADFKEKTWLKTKGSARSLTLGEGRLEMTLPWLTGTGPVRTALPSDQTVSC